MVLILKAQGTKQKKDVKITTFCNLLFAYIET